MTPPADGQVDKLGDRQKMNSFVEDFVTAVCRQQQTKMSLTFGLLAQVSSFESLWYKETGGTFDLLATLLPQPVVHIWAVTDCEWPALRGVDLHTGTKTKY